MKAISVAYPAFFFSIVSVFFAAATKFITTDVDFSKTYLEKEYPDFFVFFAVVIAPFIETVFFQSFPFLMTKRLLKHDIFKVLVLSLPFCLFHFSKTFPVLSILNGLCGGVLLGICYVFYAKNSNIQALLMTAFVHSVHNFVVVLN